MDGTRKPPRSLALNASANAVRVVLGAATAVVSTAVVTRSLDPDQYGAWGLVLQLATYFFLFDVGLTLAVAREVAVVSGPSTATDDHEASDVVSTAAVALAILAAVGLVGVAALALAFEPMFGSIPDAIVPDARWAFVLVAGSLLVGLPVAAVTGYFNGVRRSHVPALVALVVRITTTVGVVAVAASGGGIVGLGVVTAAFALVGGTALLVVGQREHPGLVRLGSASVATWRRLRAFSAHAFVYALATFAIVNLDAVLVARFDYPRLGAYVIGATVVATLGATHAAAAGALLPVVAEIAADPARRSTEALAVVRRTARYSTMFVVATVAPLLVGAHVILRVWVGDDYAASAAAPLRLLLLAAVVRFSVAVLTQTYFGLGDRWPVTGAVLVEAAVNLGASLLLGHRYGAPGVALGTVIGAGAGVVAYAVVAPRRPLGLRLPRTAVAGAARPAVAALPIAATAPWWYGWDHVSDLTRTTIGVAAVLVSLAWLVTCLSDSDRERLGRLVRRPAAHALDDR